MSGTCLYLLDARCSMLDARCSMLDARCSIERAGREVETFAASRQSFQRGPPRGVLGQSHSLVVVRTDVRSLFMGVELDDLFVDTGWLPRNVVATVSDDQHAFLHTASDGGFRIQPSTGSPEFASRPRGRPWVTCSRLHCAWPSAPSELLPTRSRPGGPHPSWTGPRDRCFGAAPDSTPTVLEAPSTTRHATYGQLRPTRPGRIQRRHPTWVAHRVLSVSPVSPAPLPFQATPLVGRSMRV
jgi:hypothetical protein